jgi:lipoic acid synthetase
MRDAVPKPMSDAPAQRRKPAWLKVKAPQPGQYRATGALLDELGLHTVCREARCPNKGECYSSGTATFLILGDSCTRACRFCAVAPAGAPRAVDDDEPRRVAEAARRLGLRHVVITSVTRDDLADGGASGFAATVEAVRTQLPAATVEVLIPDLGGDEAALAVVLAARPDVLDHNLETVSRLYHEVRPQADYQRSLQLLRRAAAWAREAASVGSALARPLVKSGLMVGLGERPAEVEAVMSDCVAVGVDALTIGQYLRPDAGCLPVARYVQPAEFAAYEKRAVALGLRVAAGPFVRSSYRAGELLGRPPGERSVGGGARS